MDVLSNLRLHVCMCVTCGQRQGQHTNELVPQSREGEVRNKKSNCTVLHVSFSLFSFLPSFFPSFFHLINDFNAPFINARDYSPFGLLFAVEVPVVGLPSCGVFGLALPFAAFGADFGRGRRLCSVAVAAAPCCAAIMLCAFLGEGVEFGNVSSLKSAQSSSSSSSADCRAACLNSSNDASQSANHETSMLCESGYRARYARINSGRTCSQL